MMSEYGRMIYEVSNDADATKMIITGTFVDH